MTYEITLHNPQQAQAAWDGIWPKTKSYLMAGHRLEMVIKKQKRSTPQNRRYWGRGVLAQIAEQVAVNGKLFSAEVWHEQFKRQFIGVIELPNGQVIGESSTKLDKKQFSDFCQQVEAYAVTELGVMFVDLPSEVNA